MNFIIPEAVITKVYRAPKSGRDYVTIEAGNSTFNVGSDQDLSKLPLLKPCKIEGVLVGSLFGKSQSLLATTFKVTPLA